MPDVNVETRATCLDRGCAYVRPWGDITRTLGSTTVGLRNSCCRCLSACTFIHGHTFSNSLL